MCRSARASSQGKPVDAARSRAAPGSSRAGSRRAACRRRSGRSPPGRARRPRSCRCRGSSAPVDRQVAVDAGERGGDRAHGLRDRAACARAVRARRPGGRTSRPARPGSAARLRSARRRARRAAGAGTGFGPSRPGGAGRASICPMSIAGPSSRSVELVVARGRARERLDRELRPEALSETAYRPLTRRRRRARRRRGASPASVPADGRQAAGGVGRASGAGSPRRSLLAQACGPARGRRRRPPARPRGRARTASTVACRGFKLPFARKRSRRGQRLRCSCLIVETRDAMF